MEIADIKEQLTLSQVLMHYGLKPDKHLRLHCPFHDDKTPSLQVYYKTHTCYCFSSNCKTHGKPLDVIDFVMHKEGFSKREAILKCKELIGGSTSAVAVPVNRTGVLQYLFTYFKNGVYNSKPAQVYLQSRGLDMTRLEIGYNTGQFHHGNRKDEGLINACLSAGLLSQWGTKMREGSPLYKPFGKYCIVFALRDSGGSISGMYFRSTVNDNDQRHYYLKDRKGLYPGYPKGDITRLILTESVIDAATLLQHHEIGKEYGILACYGTNGLTAEHEAAIVGLGQLQEIIFAFDGDDAGRKAVEKYSTLLKDRLPYVGMSSIVLPEGEDINSMGVSHTAEVFTELLQSRTGLFFSTEVSAEKTTLLLPESTAVASAGAVLDSRNPYRLVYVGTGGIYYVQGGLSKQLDSMKVTLVIEHKDSSQKSRNKIDLYEDKQVERLCREAGEKLGLRKDVLEQDLYQLTDLLDQYREAEQGKSESTAAEGVAVYTLSESERNTAVRFLRQEGLLQALNVLLGETGIVGEEQNRLFLLLVALSYKMSSPLHALIQGSSGSGKTRLLKQVSDCIPPEKVTRLTRVSDKVLYNYPERYFINRLLCLEDIDGLSEEAEFAFRELQSNGELNSATSIKLDNGQITSGQKTVKGPIASLACTTRGELYEDNMSRVFLIAVDESGNQTRRIIGYQNRKAAGEIDTGREQERKGFIRNLVRSLEALEVVNPYAGRLQLPEDAHKIRRLHDLFLNFVKMVTLLHQYQRRRDNKGRLVAELSDVESAISIMFDSIVLKVDELDGSLRQFYEQLKQYIGARGRDYEFSRFEVRDATGVGKTQQHHYINKLVELCYVRQYGHANRGYKYRIAHWDNYSGLRDRIKTHLGDQLSVLVTEHQRTPDRTPELPVVAEGD